MVLWFMRNTVDRPECQIGCISINYLNHPLWANGTRSDERVIGRKIGIECPIIAVRQALPRMSLAKVGETWGMANSAISCRRGKSH